MAPVAGRLGDHLHTWSHQPVKELVWAREPQGSWGCPVELSAPWAGADTQHGGSMGEVLCSILQTEGLLLIPSGGMGHLMRCLARVLGNCPRLMMRRTKGGQRWSGREQARETEGQGDKGGWSWADMSVCLSGHALRWLSVGWPLMSTKLVSRTGGWGGYIYLSR